MSEDKIHVTKNGFLALQKEAQHLLEGERPKVVEVVSWAASNGDRSENGDYIYGKRRLREIDRRLHFLQSHLSRAVVLDPSIHYGKEQVFLGARVTYYRPHTAEEAQVCIVGIDEVNMAAHNISWRSPMGQALLKAQVGQVVTVHTPQGAEEIEVVAVDYPAPTT